MYKREDIPWTERPTIVKISTDLKCSKDSINPYQNSNFFANIEKSILKFIWNIQEP